ncbi:MAG: hypothetical protein AB8B80_11920 [Marinicellaceae bacterium]
MKTKLKPDRSLEFYRNKKKHTSLYITAILIGACMAFYLFVFNLNHYIETMLVSGTVLWVFPIIFGYYGFFAQWLQENFQERKFRKPKDLFESIGKDLPVIIIRPLFNMLHMPLFISNKTPLFLALTGSFIWSIWIMIFFVVILPIVSR